VSSPGAPARARRDRESGQATVEFALILFPMLMLVAGIIYFGIGLNYWLDMNRVANQGARWAAVDNWPATCARTETSCTQTYTSCTTGSNYVLKNGSRARLQDVLYCSLRNTTPANCQPGRTCVTVCYPGKTPGGVTTDDPTIGDPVQVKVKRPYSFFFINVMKIDLTAKATLRLEQKPKLQTGGTGPTCT
jgi:hypothetical protein